MRRMLLLITVLAASAARTLAVVNTANTAVNMKPPTASDIAHWDSGWTQPAVQPAGFASTTGWNYVGTINGNSGTYLGNGWVLTAAHVGVGEIRLGESAYPVVPNSAQKIGTADLVLFRISPVPALPPLRLRTALPTTFIDLVAMIGWGAGGGNRNLSWGFGTPNRFDVHVPLNGSYNSRDFMIVSGPFSSTDISGMNPYNLVVGDSGGAGFIYNAPLKRWELAGIAEIGGPVGIGNRVQIVSGFVQLNTYAAQIDKIAQR